MNFEELGHIKYQYALYEQFSQFCKEPFWSYPPYCNQNDYFEEYFYINFLDKILQAKTSIKYIYIPINWTYLLKTVHWSYEDNSELKKIQKMLNDLDPKYSYFTVCTHDNAPILQLPKFTKNFSAAHSCQKFSNMFQNLEPLMYNHIQNIQDFRQDITIPLLTKKNINHYIKHKNYKKKYLASFVGSSSHELRSRLQKQYKNNTNFFIYNKNNLGLKDSMEDVYFFIEKSLESYFILCPRGWSPTSYRLYEAMQLDRVPVYISDNFLLPYENEIDWNRMCVLITPNQLNDLEEILKKEIRSGDYEKKTKYIKSIYSKYFSFENTFNYIIDNLNCGMP
jgi:hypothetical protein